MGQLLRFGIVGGGNTVLTYLLLLGLTFVVDARLAYTLAFLTGVALSAAVTGRLVFRSRPTRAQRLNYASWLILVYGAGLLAVQWAVHLDVQPSALLAAVPVLVTAPLNFAGGRLLLADRALPTPVPEKGLRP